MLVNVVTHPLADEARALTAAATPGPWGHVVGTDRHYIDRTVTGAGLATVGMRADAALIARSRTLLDEMADELDRLTGVLRYLPLDEITKLRAQIAE